jgi:hypothetical protein
MAYLCPLLFLDVVNFVGVSFLDEGQKNVVFFTFVLVGDKEFVRAQWLDGARQTGSCVATPFVGKEPDGEAVAPIAVELISVA